MNNQPVQLTLEQKFSLRSFEAQVAHMSHDQTKDFLVQLYQHMMYRETMYRHFLKHEWGLDAGFQSNAGDETK
ncbi:MAG: NblA/ycf18 family protein [Cyanobacteria bacterium J06638_20]